MAESSTITREMIEAGARALYLKDRGVPDDAWGRDLPESTMELWRGYARVALTASAAAMFGLKRRPHYSSAALGLDGMGANLRLSDGSLELVFKDEELDLINEEGRDLYVARLAGSEVLALRQWLIDFLPASEAEFRPAEVAPVLDAINVPAPGTEERHFWLEAAEQHGFVPPDECFAGWGASEDKVLKLMAASREQGRKDVLDALATGGAR
ncbi:hypothetical protein ACLBYG_21095 [Methylobacterium sp. D53M]